MKSTFTRIATLAGLFCGFASTQAQIYPMEFSISPVTTNVGLNTTFFVDVQARSTDGLVHSLSLANILVRWNPTLFTPLDLGPLDHWYSGQHGFEIIFPPLPINADGSQIGLIGGSNPLSPQNLPISPAGVSIVRLRFQSGAAAGSDLVKLPASYGGADFLMQFSDQDGVHTYFAQNIAGLRDGNVNVVPEPATLAVIATGLILLVRRRGRTR